MKEKVKKLLEVAFNDESIHEKLGNADTHEKVVEIAKSKGIDLSVDELKSVIDKKAFSKEELAAIAGGKACACVVGGGGESSAAQGGNDDLCVCVASGAGDAFLGIDEKIRCICPVVGGGRSYD